MLEQYLGEDRFREGIRRYLRRPPVRQHRDHRPVGRHRGGHRRAGPPDHGQLDLPGRLPAGRRRRRDGATLALTQERFPYLAGAEPATLGRARARGLGHRRRRAPRPSGCCSTATRVEVDLGDGRLGPGQRRAAPASTGSPTTPALRDAARRPGPGRARAHRALPVRRRPGRRRAGRAADAVDLLDAVVPLRRRDRPLGLAAHRRRGRRRCDACSTATAAGPPDRLAGELLAPCVRPAGRRAGRRRDPTATPSCGPCCSAPWARWPRTATPGQRAAELHRAYLKDRGSVDPALAAAAAGILADVGRARGLRRLPRPLPDAADPQEEQRYLYLLADFEDPEPLRPHARPDADRRGPVAERALRDPPGAHEPGAGRRRLALAHRCTGTRPSPASRPTASPGCWAGIRALDDPALADEVEAWLDEHPVPQGEKHCSQSREQLRVNVAHRRPERRAPRHARLTGPTGDGVIRLRRLQVFAVEPDVVQLSGAALGPGRCRCGPRAAARRATVDADGGPGAVDLVGLTPDTELRRSTSASPRLRGRTPAPPPGDELFRLHDPVRHAPRAGRASACFSTMREDDPEEVHTLRCTRAACRGRQAWGAQHLVLKGDLVDRAAHDEYDLWARSWPRPACPSRPSPATTR